MDHYIEIRSPFLDLQSLIHAYFPFIVHKSTAVMLKNSELHCGKLEGASALLCVCLLHLNPDPAPRVCSHTSRDPNLLGSFPATSCRPRGRNFGLGIRVHIQLNRLERLDDSSNDGRRLVVCEILSEADPRSSIKRQEYERIRDEILLNPTIQEPTRIELVRYRVSSLERSHHPQVSSIEVHRMGPIN